MKKKASSKRKPTRGKSPSSRKSKTRNFLKKLQEHNPMVEYMMSLGVLNRAAKLVGKGEASAAKREGRFVQLAHSNVEFEAPVITKGKSAANASKKDDIRRKK